LRSIFGLLSDIVARELVLTPLVRAALREAAHYLLEARARKRDLVFPFRHRRILSVQQFRLPAQRGAAPLAYYQGGASGPVLVLANGLGGPVAAFRHQVEHFAKRYRVVTWDYRGLYGSRSVTPLERVDVPAHAQDLERVLDTLGVERAVFIGWSMGVQVVLELVARAPSRASHLVLMSGTYRRPFASVRLPGADRWLSPLVGGARENSVLVSRVVERLARSRRAAEWVRRLRIVHPSLETNALLALAEEFTTIDFDVYFRTLNALNEHDASPALARVRAPALVVTGSRDLILPPSVARELARRLPRAELFVVPRGTHYAPAEFPEIVNQRIDRFLSAHASAFPLTEPDAGARISAP
jgi:pimeloyl-ACP methyl ester carboxylesterase